MSYLDLNPMTAAEKAAPKFTKNGGFLTVRAEDTINAMTVSWWSVGWIWHRPVLTVAVRPTRHTYGLIEIAEDFTLSIPDPDMPEALMTCGTKSGKTVDKFTECNLETIPARASKTPVINIPGIHYECRIILRSPIQPALMDKELEKLYSNNDYHTMYYGEILNCYQL